MNMSKIVRSAANLLFPFILVFGFYIVLHGHLTPGGGFQGGAVIATGFVLMFVAYSYDFITGRIGAESLHTTETIGLVLFIVTALVAIVFGVTFFTNWMLDVGPVLNNPVAFGPNPGDLNTAGFIPVMNLAVGIEVLGALSVIVLYMLSGTKEEI